MISSENTAELATALSIAQGELENATKDKTNPAFRSKYADINACLEVVRPCLSRHGLAVVQGIGHLDADRISVTTRLLHKSGQWLESTLSVPLGKKDAQGVGAAATYGRRYGLTAMLGLGQEDDDGNAASGITARESSSPRTQTPATPVPMPSMAKSKKPVDIDWLKLAFESVQKKEDLAKLSLEYAKLTGPQQEAIRPLATAARNRLGL